jgi:hypothetical protein
MSEATSGAGVTTFIPGFRGACHRAALRADPLAPCGLRCFRFRDIADMAVVAAGSAK